MIPAPRVPRPSRPVLLTIMVTALLTFPMGIVLASHQFGDVPNSNPFHADIDALVDAGITAGCGNGNYCPKANVTREQMAAFMNRLGALAPGKTPVVNADKVDGLDATVFHRFGTAPGATTQTGSFTLGVEAVAGGNRGFGVISYPVRMSSALTGHVIGVAGVPPAGCSGSVTAPAASPGHVCVFVGFQTNVASVGLFSPYTGGGGTGREGIAMNVITTAAGTAVAVGTWAATAPLTLAAPAPAPAGPNIVGN